VLHTVVQYHYIFIYRLKRFLFLLKSEYAVLLKYIPQRVTIGVMRFLLVVPWKFYHTRIEMPSRAMLFSHLHLERSTI
jgi:hypothetical protein